MLIIDDHGGIRACGQSLARLLGRDADDLAGRPVWTLLPGWSPFRGVCTDSRLRLVGSRISVPVRVLGETLHLPGETLFMLDVRRPRGVGQGSADAVMVTDRHGEIRYVNPAFEAMTGYGAADVAGLTPALLKSGAHAPATYRRLWDTILDGRIYRGTLINHRKDGSRYCEDKVIRPVRDRLGRPVLFLCSGREVSRPSDEARALPERSAVQ